MKAYKMIATTEGKLDYDATPTGDYAAEAKITDMDELLVTLTKKPPYTLKETKEIEIITIRFDRYTTQKIRAVLAHTK